MDRLRLKAGAVALVVVPLAAIAWLLVRDGDLDLEVFLAMQSVARAGGDPAWSMLTLLGTGVVAFALLSPTLAWRPRFFASAIAAAAFAGLYTNGLKRLLALPRPAAILDPVQVHVIGDRLSANSFPSGHSVTAFTLAALLVFAARRPLAMAACALPCAALIAFSRVAVGAHWPADLAAGAAGGWLSGALGVACASRWRHWNCVRGVRAMGVVALGIGVSLFVVELGYPLALPLQYAAAVIALAAGATAVARPRLDAVWPRVHVPST